MMIFSVLGSGSRGNSIYIEGKRTKLLIDCGFSGKNIEHRLHSLGRSLRDVRALCLTHEHDDHIAGAGAISRRFKIPVIANQGTLNGGERKLGKLYAAQEFETGDILEIEDFIIRSFRIHHDTADPVGYIISDGKFRLGCCTDTGMVSKLMIERLKDCHALILEFNHNLEMLKNGPYPLPLQQRIRSKFGHLSNEDAADCLEKVISDCTKVIVLAHLSETNNKPILAQKAALDILQKRDDTLLVTAEQLEPLPLIDMSLDPCETFSCPPKYVQPQE
jgi:phosphoribosyl 1,2-cyclic phosphodiesterase